MNYCQASLCLLLAFGFFFQACSYNTWLKTINSMIHVNVVKGLALSVSILPICLSFTIFGLLKTPLRNGGPRAKISIKVWLIVCLSLQGIAQSTIFLFNRDAVPSVMLLIQYYSIYYVVNTKLDMRFNVQDAYLLSEGQGEEYANGQLLKILTVCYILDHRFRFLLCFEDWSSQISSSSCSYSGHITRSTQPRRMEISTRNYIFCLNVNEIERGISFCTKKT